MTDLFPLTLEAFAVWLGSAAAAGVIVSLLLERIPAFKNWHGKGKGSFVLGLYVALPFVSKWLVAVLAGADPGLLASAQQALGLALGGLAAWGASQYAHQNDRY